jgi:nucleoside 2-deoxyribosyltransferase
MKIFFVIKFHEDLSNKKEIEEICESLRLAGAEIIVTARDYEKWGGVVLNSAELMRLAFKTTDESDLLLVEFSEKGVGLGIEAGYAYAKGIPIVVIAKKGSDISKTMEGVAKEVIFYEKAEDVGEKIRKYIQ